MTDVLIDARRGAGSSLEILYGTVTWKPTLTHSRGTSVVLPAPTTYDLVDGQVVATNVQPTPAPVGGQVEWAYEVTFKDRHSKSYSFLVGVPDSTTQVNFTSLPRYFETKPPLFGQGPQGDQGESATVAVGTVTGGATAQVTNSGTNTDAVLNFVLPKGDKGDTGAGVPAGGTALQYIRKTSDNTTTEWATLANATGLAAGLMPASDKSKLDSATENSTATTIAMRNADGQLATQDPTVGTHAANQRYVLSRTNAEVGASMDLRTADLVNASTSTLRSAIHTNFVDRFRSDTGRIALGSGALSSLSDTYAMPVNATVVSVGYNAHANMTAVRQSIAIGSGAMSQGTMSRDNIAIGDDSGWAIQSYSPLYDQNNREGTRNVMVGGLSGRFNKSGIAHVLIGRGAGASIVSGRGAVVIGSNAHVSSQPIGLSGEIENWANAFAGNPESRALVVAIGESSLSQNVGKNNTAIGASTLEFNTIGQYNTAVGVNSLATVGSDTWYNGGLQRTLSAPDGTYTQSGNQVTITAEGHGAVAGDIARFRLIGGSSPTFAGDYAYAYITSVTANSYTIEHPVSRNTSGTSLTSRIITGTPKTPSQYNTGVGGNTLPSLLTGSNNTALGYSAGSNLVTGSDNTFFGYNAGGRLTSGSRNMNFGFQSGNFLTDDSAATAVENSITIGPYARVSGSNEVQIGTSAQTVYTYNAVQTRSDIRDKREVRDSVLGLEFVNALRPVDYKTAFRDNAPGDTGKGNRYHHGFIAQELLEFEDFGGVQDHKLNGGADVLTVAYSELIAPMVRAIQELTDRVIAVESL